MAEHKAIQNPDNYSDKDYQKFHDKLFSSSTTKAELEEICMTLAHLPTKKAQELLSYFQKSERASEVEWLEFAIEEGQFHYLSPENEQEEKDLLASKVIQEMEEKIIELDVEYDDFKQDIEKKTIEQEAIKELVKKKQLDKDALLGFEDYKYWIECRMEELRKEIAIKEKTVEQIQGSIKTDKYKDIDTDFTDEIPF